MVVKRHRGNIKCRIVWGIFHLVRLGNQLASQLKAHAKSMLIQLRLTRLSWFGTDTMKMTDVKSTKGKFIVETAETDIIAGE